MATYKDTLLKQILDRLVPAFKPKRVYLFGSQVKGTASEDSDYDLIFVVEKMDKPSGDLMVEASRLLRGVECPVDVFFYSEDEYQEKLKEFGSIPETAKFEGQELVVDVG